MEGTLTIVVGEVLKITLVERLFRLTRDRLMQIPIFAFLYRQWIWVHQWITSSKIWQWIRRRKERLKLLFSRAKASIRAPRRAALPSPNVRATPGPAPPTRRAGR